MVVTSYFRNSHRTPLALVTVVPLFMLIYTVGSNPLRITSSTSLSPEVDTINITAVIDKDQANRTYVTDLVTNQFFPGRPFLESIIVELCRDIVKVFGGREVYGIELLIFDFTIRRLVKIFLWLDVV